MYHPGASWCVVVGGGDGVVHAVHEGHVREGSWLLVVGARNIARNVVPEVAQGGNPVSLSHVLVSMGWRGVRGGPCWARGSGCGPWYPPAPARGVRRGVAPS